MKVSFPLLALNLAPLAVASLLIGSITAGCGGASGPPPAPTATPKPVCTVGKGTYAATCARGTTLQFGPRVDAAIAAVIASNPAYFDTAREANVGQKNYLVKNGSMVAFRNAVVRNLQDEGLCAEADNFSDVRIKVKNSADFHEDYNIRSINLGKGSFIQYSPTSYDTSCSPAAFPLDPNPNLPPPDQGCGDPYPPEIDQIGIKIQLRFASVFTLDSTPQIRNNAPYCWDIGYRDGRDFCPLRAEGKPERVPCENWRIGRNKDTNLLGPTWTRDNKPCTGPESGCENHEYNHYHLYVHATDGQPHVYRACPEVGGCGEITIAH